MPSVKDENADSHVKAYNEHEFWVKKPEHNLEDLMKDMD